MAKARIRVHSAGARRVLTADRVQAYLTARAEAIATACNGQSSWGGYHAEAAGGPGRARAVVYSADARNDEPRDQRLVRNLHAGGA